MIVDHWLAFLYAVGVIICVYPFRTLLINYIVVGSKPDGFDHFMGAFIGFMAALLWPILVVGIAIYRLSKKIWDPILGVDEKKAREKHSL